MPFGKGRRKLLWVLCVFLAGIVAIWLSVPLWFPWLFGPLAERAGARFTSYARLGYNRFSLSNFVFTNESMVLTAGEIQGFVPNVWLWELAKARKDKREAFLSVNGWACELLPSTNSTTSAYSQVQDVAETLHLIQHWVPKASLTRGSVRSGTNEFSIPSATWQQGTLQAEIKTPESLLSETFEATLAPARPFHLQVAVPDAGLASTITITTNLFGFEVGSTTSWRSNRLELQARFDTVGTLPITAAVQAVNFKVPAQMLKLPGYDDVAGSLSALWSNSQFVVDLSASGHPASGETNLPLVQVELRSRGDTNSATIELLNVRAPFVQASLSNPITVLFSAPYLQGTASLDLSADLSQQHFVPVTGTLKGSTSINAGPDNRPSAMVHFTGKDLGSRDVKAQSVELSAHLQWPLSVIDRAELRFEDGSSGTISAQVDLEKRTATDGKFHFHGPLAQRWLPADYSFQELSVEGSFSGPLEKPAHEGRIEITELGTPYLKPLNLSGQWKGELNAIQRFELRVTAPDASLGAEGSVTADQSQADLRLNTLSLATNQVTALELGEPVLVKFSNTNGVGGFRLVTSALHWLGSAGQIEVQSEVQWPTEGHFQLALRQFSPDLLNAFAKTNFPQINIQNLSVFGNWTNGPLSFSVEATGSGTPSSMNPGETTADQTKRSQKEKTAGERMLGTPLTFELKVEGDRRGILISNLVVHSSTADVVNVRGFLPITITPAATNLLAVDSQKQLDVAAEVRPQAFFWESVAEMTGVRLQEPQLDLSLNGSWSAPAGRILFGAKAIQFKPTTTNQLALEDLRLDLSLNQTTARLTEGHLSVQGQSVRVEGELPLEQAWWTSVSEKKLPDWTKAKARIRMQGAKVAAFQPLFPELLAPQGDLNLDLEVLPGLNFNGFVVLLGARTRPLGNVAPVRNINVTLRFRERQLELENATANLGGATLKITGAVDLRGTNWLSSGELPPFRFLISGTNVPLARAPEYIIRSDLDLTSVKTNGAPPLVTGTARLRDSFFLSDLSGLIPSKVETPDSRPPYFSIDNPTLADWRLAVTVEGVRWLRVRASLLNGLVSANLHLQGTLKDPIALGGTTVDSGLVRFPFANFQVQQGLVTLTSQDPYHPQLLVRAASKQFGYDLHMEVSGAADSPVIQFTSNPPLSSEQILLMITAGQLPAGAFTLTPQQRAQTVALFLGRDLLTKLGFGDQSQERLTISSGEEVSEQGRPTYSVEYKLTDRWSVVGEYDRFGDFNAGLKWRVYSK